jgi:hypothetical protein
MAKIPSDHLFRIIKSLSGAEKRYFKLYAKATGQGEPLYLALFEMMDTAPAFDDVYFQSKLYKKQADGTKKYSVLKAYLYDLILASLQSYDKKQSVVYKLNALLQSVAVLFRRGLYADCEPILHKAEKLANTYESYVYVLEIMDWRKQLAYTRADIDYLDKELQQIHAKEQDAMRLQAEILTARQSFFNVLLQVRRDVRVTKAAPDTASIDRTTSASIKANIFQLRTHNLQDYAAQDPEAFRNSGAELLTYIELHPHFLKENLTEYIAALSNYIVACGMLSHYDEVEKTLLKLRNLSPNTHDDRMKIHRQYYSNSFAMCVFTGAFAAGKALMEAHKLESAQLGLPRYESDTTLVQYFLICFGNKEYDDALEYLNDWMNQPRTVGRQDIQSIVRMLNLIIHYEQGNAMLLEYKLRGTERYMRSRSKDYALERLFIRLITDLIKLNTSSERQDRCQKAKNELQLIQDQPVVRTILKTFDFDAWLSSKINSSSFAEVVQAKYRLTAIGIGV